MTAGLTAASRVWNRGIGLEPADGIGDQHLRAMSTPYSQIMANGTTSVRETSTPDEILRAADAFDYFGLGDLADLTRRLATVEFDDDCNETGWNRAFWGLEQALDGAFERRYRESPRDFDPVPPDQPVIERALTICPGELIVHERQTTCTEGDGCPRRPKRYVLHDRSRLHRDADCELCSSGPTWAD